MDITKTMKRWCENITILETISLYQNFMDRGKISHDGAASKRLTKLRGYRKEGYIRFEDIPAGKK